MPPEHPQACTHCASFSNVLQYKHEYFCVECEGLAPLNRYRTSYIKRINRISLERYNAHFAFCKRVIEGGLAA